MIAENYGFMDNLIEMFFLKNIQLRQEFDRILFLYFLSITLVVLALFLEFFIGLVGLIELFIKFFVIILFAKMIYKALKNLQYSFWTYIFFVYIYVVCGIYQNLVYGGRLQLFFLYLLLLFILILGSYLFSSPIYFPRVYWWIYDVRFKSDIHIKVKVIGDYSEDALVAGRLTDLRRNAGSIILFHEYNIGTRIFLYSELECLNVRLFAEIISKREYLFGRGHLYGVKFLYEDMEDKKIYNDFIRYWRKKRRIKNMMRIEDF